MLGELTPRSIDAISSYGERLSSYIVALAFEHFGVPAVHVDSRKVIVTDQSPHAGRADLRRNLRAPAATVPPLADEKRRGDGRVHRLHGRRRDVNARPRRFGFHGLDRRAGVGAEEIQIWTDVDGMLTADPTILPGGHRVKTISFAEAAELAYFGAKVLHPSTVIPAIERNIPVLILNSRRPEVAGTRIVSEAVHCTMS